MGQLEPAASREEHVRRFTALHASLTPVANRPRFERISVVASGIDSLQLYPLSNSVLGVIVETREQPGLVEVILEAVNLAGLQIVFFHGRLNRTILEDQRIRLLLDSGFLIASELNTTDLPPCEYNGLLLSEEFWRPFADIDKVLVFQADAFFCPGARDRLPKFLHFDYIGTPWTVQRPIGIRVPSGCGGFSLRDVKLSLAAIQSMSPSTWPGGEDSFFAASIEALGGRVANVNDSRRWGAQNSWRGAPIGGHQPHHLSAASRLLLALRCPSSRRLPLR